jgi:glycosyltransferase involved in cell wall biosynthesis
VRITHVNLARGFRGGERQTELLIRELARRDVAQRLLVRRSSPLRLRLADVRGLEVRVLPWPYLPFAHMVGSPEIIHAHDGRSPTFATVAGSLAGCPVVITRRIQPPPRSSFWNRWAYGGAAGLVGVSTGVRDVLSTYAARDDVEVIPSALADLPVDRDASARIRARYRGRWLAVCAAALVEAQKGQSYLIEAVRRIASRWPELHVVLLGEGPSLPDFERQAAMLDQVELVGFVSNLGDWLAAADAFVLPSLHEGAASVLFDAFHAGLPVVATDIPGVTDVVHEGETGLLVPSADPDALAAALLRLRDEPGLRERLSERARAVATQYRPERMADRYLTLYRRLAQSSRS